MKSGSPPLAGTLPPGRLLAISNGSMAKLHKPGSGSVEQTHEGAGCTSTNRSAITRSARSMAIVGTGPGRMDMRYHRRGLLLSCGTGRGIGTLRWRSHLGQGMLTQCFRGVGSLLVSTRSTYLGGCHEGCGWFGRSLEALLIMMTRNSLIS